MKALIKQLTKNSNFFQLNQLLTVSKLDGSSDDPIRPSYGNYILAAPVLSDDAGTTYGGSSPGISTAAESQVFDQDPGGAPAAAVSLTDFNTLRLNIGTTIATLSNKVDSILDISELNCNIR